MSDEKTEPAQEEPIAKGKTPHDRHSVREVRTYVDDGGREVKEFVQVMGKSKEPSFYKGRAVIQVRMAGPGGVPMPPRMQPFEFDLEAASVRKAFELFDETAEAELQKMRKQANEQNRVIPAGGRRPILGANGRPLVG